MALKLMMVLPSSMIWKTTVQDGLICPGEDWEGVALWIY